MASRKDGDVISCHYLTNDFNKDFKSQWSEKIKTISSQPQDGAIVSSNPFSHAFIPNFFQDEDLLKELVSELDHVKLVKKNNDLYKFKCTDDLKKLNSPSIKKICSYLKGPVKSWVQNLTGIRLNDNVAISSSRYDYTDVLLCHDDELEGRRVAFILYLTPSWQENFGGSLDLFSVNDLKQPSCLVKRIYPKFNSFAFFEVSPVSFHQVAEVLVKDVPRITLNGWFHGEAISYPHRPICSTMSFLPPGEVEEEMLYSWLNPLYLNPSTQADIRRDFQDKSEIQLPDFLQNKKYKLLMASLKNENLVWSFAGPPNERHFEFLLDAEHKKGILEDFIHLMHSDAMCLILSQLTGLSLHSLYTSDSENSDSDPESDAEEFLNHISNKDSDESEKEDSLFETEKNGTDVSSNAPSSSSIKKRKKQIKSIDPKKSKIEACELDPSAAVSGLVSGWQEENCEKATHKPDAEDPASSFCEVRSDIRRWRWGAYSLMKDDQLERHTDFILDASFFSTTSKWNDECGGQIVYVAKGEDEELLTINPSSNSLALVYRDKETFRFTKHLNANINKVSPNNHFGYFEIFSEFKEITKT